MISVQPFRVTFRVVSQERGLVGGEALLSLASYKNRNVGLGGGKHVLWDG